MISTAIDGYPLAGANSDAVTDDHVVANDDGADHRVRRRTSPSLAGKRKRPAHVRSIA